MNAFEQLESYLRSIERRLRMMALTRGAAITAASALVATVLLVMTINGYAFSERSLVWARFGLFLALAFAIGFGVIAPLLKLNTRRAARAAESESPDFQERLLTFAEKKTERDPFLELLAMDTLETARRAEPSRVVPSLRLAAFLVAGLLSTGVLVWLTTSGPGYWGHGASLLWAGTPRDVQPFYSITVTPGDRRVRRRTDQRITAQLLGFQASTVRLMARYQGSTRWEQAQMTPQPQGGGFEFLLAGLPESVDYYVEAGAIKSKEFKITVVDLPGVKEIRVTYKYPAWSGLREVSEEGSGDLRAVTGTEAEVAIRTDRPLKDGLLVFDNQTEIPLKDAGDGWMTARVKIEKDGMYHIAAIDEGQKVRISDDFFIEARQESAPIVKILRPRTDARVSPIEEVAIEVDAQDDFGLSEVSLRYSVNGGEEKTVSVLPKPGVTGAQGKTLITLEDYKLVPGDVVSMYAVARDARQSAQTDMVFVQAVPFEYSYSQSQQMGGGGGGEQEDQNQISQRQKEIIAATWNQIRDKWQDKGAQAENAKFLAEVQGKLRDQATSLAKRMRSRELAGTNQQFKNFAQDMEKASEAMGHAVDKLKAQGWKDAMPHEQKALQHLLRAESTFREIQVAFGSQGGGGGGGGGRDLASLFDLELDTEKNQYETGQQSGGGGEQRQKEIDEALQKLEQLARRQKELAEQMRNQQQKNTPQQRWQQEMLRREAEELQKQMEQMSRGQQQQMAQNGQQGQQGQQSSGQGGQQQQQQQQSQQDRMRQMSQQMRRNQSGAGGSQIDPRVERALERLKQATEDMRRQGQQEAGGGDASSRRAAERLQEATDMLSSLRKQEAGSQVDDMVRRAEQLAGQQKDVHNQLRQMYGQGNGNDMRQMAENARKAQELARQKDQMVQDLEKLERDMQRATRELSGANRKASSKVRETLGEMQGSEVARDMKFGAEWLRRGIGSATYMREQRVTNAIERMRLGLREAQEQLEKDGGAGQAGSETEKALAQVEKLRAQLQKFSQGQGKEKGQQGQRGDQQGDQQGQQGQDGREGNQRGQNGKQGQKGQKGQGQQGEQAGDQQGEGQQPGQQGGQRGPQGQRGQQGQGQSQGQAQTAGNNQQGGQRGEGGIEPNGEIPRGQRTQGGGDRDGFRQHGYSALNDGGLRAPGGALPAEMQRGLESAYREGLRDLNEVRRALSAEDGETAKEVGDLIRQMQSLDPARFPGNPALLEQMRAQLLPNLEQLEIQLRRQIEEKQGGQVRTGTSAPVPAGYADAVAEYFRKLSKGK